MTWVLYFPLLLFAMSSGLQAAELAAPLSEEASLEAAEDLARELEATIALGEESEQEISIDAEGSIDISEDELPRTWTIRSDVRLSATYSDLKPREGEPYNEEDLLGRARIGLSRSLTDAWRIGARLSAACTSESCRPDTFFDEETQGSADAAISVDEAFLHWFHSDRFNLVMGRMQTKFITKGGVFAKSMSRNDSNNTRITWTDGVHGTFRFDNGWEPHLILQHNPEDGPAQITREPLDFEDSDSRVSAFVSITNEKPVRFLTQRAFDISYYPASLKKDGLVDDSRLEDYWGFNARVAGRYPKRSSGRRLRFSLEGAYAPQTPTRSGVGLSGSGDTSGWAGAVTVALMDFVPKHSIGLNFAHTGAGWLLSPQYNKNEQLAEIRYVWVAHSSLTFDFRVRYRKEIDQLVTAERKREEIDAFARLTWRRTKERKAFIN
jgi:hypothetical protein